MSKSIGFLSLLAFSILAMGSCHKSGSQPADIDSDASLNGDDNCPYFPNPMQTDVDEDGRGEPCDNCPFAFNPGQQDSDHDGIGNACDCAIEGSLEPVIENLTQFDWEEFPDSGSVSSGLFGTDLVMETSGYPGFSVRGQHCYSAGQYRALIIRYTMDLGYHSCMPDFGNEFYGGCSGQYTVTVTTPLGGIAFTNKYGFYKDNGYHPISGNPNVSGDNIADDGSVEIILTEDGCSLATFNGDQVFFTEDGVPLNAFSFPPPDSCGIEVEVFFSYDPPNNALQPQSSVRVTSFQVEGLP